LDQAVEFVRCRFELFTKSAIRVGKFCQLEIDDADCFAPLMLGLS